MEGDLFAEEVRRTGVRGGEKEGGVGANAADQGEVMPGVWAVEDCLGASASEAAFNNKFVVPSAFVEPDRAEQTTATL